MNTVRHLEGEPDDSRAATYADGEASCSSIATLAVLTAPRDSRGYILGCLQRRPGQEHAMSDENT